MRHTLFIFVRDYVEHYVCNKLPYRIQCAFGIDWGFKVWRFRNWLGKAI